MKVRIFHAVADAVEAALKVKGIDVHLYGKLDRPCGLPDVTVDDIDKDVLDAIYNEYDDLCEEIDKALHMASGSGADDARREIRAALGIKEDEDHYDDY